MLMRTGKYFSGTSGLLLPYKNKSFYPEAFQDKSRLTFYGSLFNTIEINSSFYKLPQKSTVGKWAESVPEDFRFTFKLWKEVTHDNAFSDIPGKIIRFMDVIEAAAPKKGCLLVQFPPGMRFGNFRQVKAILEGIALANGPNGYPVALEFRHSSWYREETYSLLNAYGATLVLHDKTNSHAPLEEMNAAFVYLRFHGPEGNYRGSYEEHFLYEYAQYIREWLSAGKDVYSYFNNTMGDAIGNLRTLRQYVMA